MPRPAGWLVLVLSAWGPMAHAEGAETWNFAKVIAAARGAPEVRLARARETEASAGVAAARVTAVENPALETLVGPRWADPTTTDIEVGLSWPIPIGGVRGKRIAVARAGATRAGLLVHEAGRQAVASAARAFFQVLHAEQRRQLAEARLSLARELSDAAAIRERAGDVAGFEVRLAEGELARAQAATLRMDADVVEARGQLALAVGADDLGGAPVQGALAPDVFTGLQASGTRPDVEAARAEQSAAAAEIVLADAGRFPALALRVTYAREEKTDVLLGGIEISLPLFQRAQGPRREARARRQRATLEADLLQRRAAAEVTVARKSFASALAAAHALSQDALRRVAENETLAVDAYRAGKIDLTTLILLRRDALETREDALDRNLTAALAGVDLWVALGAPPLRSQP